MHAFGAVARRTGVEVATIRDDEQIGLLPPAARSVGNPRLDDDAAGRRLAFVRDARELGFSLGAVRDLSSLTDRPEQPATRSTASAARARIAECRVIAAPSEGTPGAYSVKMSSASGSSMRSAGTLPLKISCSRRCR